MLDLLELISGFVILAAYLGLAFVLPSAVVILFIALIGTLIRTGLDIVVGALPPRARDIAILVRVGHALRGIFIWAVGSALFLALVGFSSPVPGPNILAAGFGQMIVTVSAIADIVAQWFTGQEQLSDVLLQLIPAEGAPPLAPVELFQEMVSTHLFNVIQPGVNLTTFKWTFAAFTTSVVGFWLVFEPIRAIRARVSQLIAPPQQQQATLSQESLERQAEMIAQALAKATPGAAIAAAPAQPVSAWGRPSLSRAAAPTLAPPAPGAIASQRVAVVTWDGELAAELERQLDGAGFAPQVMRSVAEAFASRVWPAIVFIDARHLQWLSPDRLPLLVRARLVAVTREGVRVPAGWQLDTHAVEAGADTLLDLLRRRDSRRRAGAREPGA